MSYYARSDVVKLTFAQLNEVRLEIAKVEDRIKVKLEEERQVGERITTGLQALNSIESEVAELGKQKRTYINLEKEIAQKRKELEEIKISVDKRTKEGKIREYNVIRGLLVERERLEGELAIIGARLGVRIRELDDLKREIQALKSEKEKTAAKLEDDITKLGNSLREEKDGIEKERTLIIQQRVTLDKERKSIRQAEVLLGQLAQQHGAEINWQEQ